MSRPKSEEKRGAILEAAVRVICAQGVTAPTAAIAKEAGVANGTLFTYFPTKTELFNELYLELKTGMAKAALGGIPQNAELRKQVFQAWSNWMGWAVENPEQRRAIAQLGVCEEITPATRRAAQKAAAGLAGLMEKMRSHGSLRNTTVSLAGALLTSVAEATMDLMIKDGANAKKHCKEGFEALWRMIS